jgi:hypothetical protein
MLRVKLSSFMSGLSRFAHRGFHLQIEEVLTLPFTPFEPQ